jgi:hypothetical protein
MPKEDEYHWTNCSLHKHNECPNTYVHTKLVASWIGATPKSSMYWLEHHSLARVVTSGILFISVAPKEMTTTNIKNGAPIQPSPIGFISLIPYARMVV